MSEETYGESIKPLEEKIFPKKEQKSHSKGKPVGTICNIIGVISILVGLIFVMWMVGTLMEFQAAIDDLHQQILYSYGSTYGEYIWNQPEVQDAIQNGYMMLIADKAVIFVPLFIIGAISLAAKKIIISRTQEKSPYF
jgi:hypothetical protein